MYMSLGFQLHKLNSRLQLFQTDFGPKHKPPLLMKGFDPKHRSKISQNYNSQDISKKGQL